MITNRGEKRGNQVKTVIRGEDKSSKETRRAQGRYGTLRMMEMRVKRQGSRR